ncbi:MAG TPA: hypothetical protein VGL61_19995 [Kofleriaceae bacterium]
MEITEATPATLAKWPLWTWFAYPALAIAIGGGLGWAVAVVRQAHEPSPPIQATAEPVVATPAPSAPSHEVAPPPPPEIEISPEPMRAAVTPKPKGRAKPAKRCNVYDHMDGC